MQYFEETHPTLVPLAATNLSSDRILRYLKFPPDHQIRDGLGVWCVAALDGAFGDIVVIWPRDLEGYSIDLWGHRGEDLRLALFRLNELVGGGLKAIDPSTGRSVF